MEIRSIAIDGPSGAGKSTMAKMLAKKFGLIYVDTGAIYRTVGLYAKNCGVASKDADGVKALLDTIKIEMKYDESGTQRMYLNGEDVSEAIRMPEISIYASDVSAMPDVRAFLLQMQRSLAEDNDVIMDGRDIGTVVLKNAGLKIFLSADVQDRARRRLAELAQKGVDTTFDDVYRDMCYRDENDSNRAAAPLRAAEDAIMVDTTGNTVEETQELLSKMVSVFRKKVSVR